MKIITVLGTRPEITKLSPLLPLLDKEFEHILIHTGQHYDDAMDGVFFRELQLRLPDYNLAIGSHTPAKQLGLMLERIEEIVLKEKPDLIVVLGDTHSTFAGALVAAKQFVPLLYIEAGCRSFSKELPEELHKTVIPFMADYMISPDKICHTNLIRVGIPSEKIFLFGSMAFDAVIRNRQLIPQNDVLERYGLRGSDYVLLTLHRAENTDNLTRFQEMLRAINRLAVLKTFVFPVHPRTRKIIKEQKMVMHPNIKIIEPASYLTFLALLSSSRVCMSDSGGVQEEALVFNVPCLILRNVTEWTRLVDAGKNVIVGTEEEVIVKKAEPFLRDDTLLERVKAISYPFETGVAEKIVEVIRHVAGTRT